jgi:hypothetical protein
MRRYVIAGIVAFATTSSRATRAAVDRFWAELTPR